MIKRTLGCMALCTWFMAGGSLMAHHSLAGVYDMKQETELSGSVESVKSVNPHGSLTLSVKNPDGSTTPWVMTLGSATSLAQTGNRYDGTKCAPRRGQHQGEVHPR